MNKFLRSVRSTTNKKDDLIKQSITTQLSNSVKEIQYAGIEENKTNNAVNIFEAASALCTTVEAMMLHGLKDSLTHRFKRVIADVEERPEPSFWPPLLVISHRQIVDQITNLSQISTEVGQCRAWIRLALNDCLLSSYLMTMRQDSSALKSFYRVDAYVRDAELLEVAQRLIEGVEAFKTFVLPCNSSLLNTWPLPSLFLAGIWAPTMKACPVAPCDDVAQSIDNSAIAPSIPETGSETTSLSSAFSYTSQSSGLRQIVALTEDEVLKIILAKETGQGNNSQSLEDLKSSCSSDQEKSSDLEGVQYNVGNSLNRATGWSFDENQEIINVEKEVTTSPSFIKENENEGKSMDASYNALIESYNMLSVIKTPDFREVWQKYEEERNSNISPADNVMDETPESGAYSPTRVSTRTESTPMAVQIRQIAREKGLDVQSYLCADCQQHLGILHKPNVCAFTGDYFCDSCMSTEQVPIPARIIYNWDFKTYPISQKALKYLNEVKDHPVVDFKVVNPYIYSVVEEMAQLQILRNQLNFLRAYLYTCREPVIEQLQKMIWPREYMYEHIHQYSISDLSEITSGILLKRLEEVVQFGREHVSSCWLCSQKGFVCEVCNKPKALFPFDVENVYRCDICNAVYHKNCLNSSKPCPKCERKKKREELPLLGAISIE
ncbi:hypothetical protein NQ315_009019 [Exocentrus adspersus]|uniref:RUN domain-containing protein n=1 Tax=Exocentrus adspersus TaxID=1586481 RepID=A0AAV8VGI4_9CUCU|nr:hypothetical protein NQ315_009019 [Exocentrus adspersus]